MNSKSASTSDLPVKAPTPEAVTWRYSGIFELLSKVVLLGGPVFYVLGRIYAQGYWITFGLPSSALGVDAEDYIFFGFVVIANFAQFLVPPNSVPVWAPMLLAFTSLAVLACFFWVFRRLEILAGRIISPFVRQFRQAVAEKLLVRDALRTAAGVVFAACSVSLVLLLVWTALVIPVFIANSLGRRQANQVITEIKTGKGPYQEVQIGGKPAGRLIECPNEYCVIAKNDSFALVRLEEVQWIKL